MKKRTILFLTILFSLFVILSACGSNGNDAEDEAAQDDTEETPVTEEETDEEPEEDESAEEEEADDNGGNEEDASEENEDSAEEGSEVVDENVAFRIFEPVPDTVVENEFTVRGEANVNEGIVHYEFEDGHNILDEGTVTASAAAPDWGTFEFTISFDEVAFNTGLIILYTEDPEDGSRQHELIIPVSVQ